MKRRTLLRTAAVLPLLSAGWSRVFGTGANGEFPGAARFIGLGQLPPEALRLLWPIRKPVTPGQLALGNDVWTALASSDPRQLAAIARSGTPALPIMAAALHRHLRELPAGGTVGARPGDQVAGLFCR